MKFDIQHYLEMCAEDGDAEAAELLIMMQDRAAANALARWRETADRDAYEQRERTDNARLIVSRALKAFGGKKTA